MPALAVSYSGLLGGAERVLLAIAVGLSDPPLLACPSGPLADAARAGGLGVFELRERSLELRRSPRDRVATPLRIAAQATEVRALVRGQRPDVLIAWGMRAGLVCATAYPRGEGPPLLLQHHDFLPGPMIGRAVRMVARRAAAVITCSRCLAAELDPDGALGGRLTLVPFGVDLQRFRPAGPERAVAGAGADRNVREIAAGERSDALAFAADAGHSAREIAPGAGSDALVLGAIERWKRPDLALEAVALAAVHVPALRVRLLGAPIGDDGARLLDELRARAARPDLAGRVELAGPVADPRGALQAAACLLHCADREPYGMVVAEALASGLPVVVPASCGPAEIADPSCGRLYAPGDPGAAARALAEVLGDAAVAARMGTAARARAEACLDVDQTRARFAALIADLGRARAVSDDAAASAPTETAAAASRSASNRPAVEGAGAALAIVTVIHDSEPELRALLASVARQVPAAQVIVVDSGSSDGGAALARAWRGGLAEVVDVGENVGFGRGVNAGLARAQRPVAALLNPDVELLDASLGAAAREATLQPRRLLAPLVLSPGGARQDSAQREPGSAPLALHALVPGALLPRRIAATAEPWRAAAPRRVGWAVGCALVGDVRTLRELGPFDERVFMYGEDLDLGLRASDAAIETWFWPAARVLHHGAHSTVRAFGGEPFELLAARRRAVVREHRGPARALADDALQATTFASRALLKRLAGRDDARERRQLHALRAARRGQP